ncbi:hypothetical protein [uncultured Methanolobus sp.]|uniref:LVIVD repeat-containing protein n=1 Tax=uncultured Methanolobus sp. TaxID=218300 RepID=UPI0029C7A932|nr:hypothetical protein [uncultured Methanolobus sp.]
MQLTDKIKKYHKIIGITILFLLVIGIVVTGGNELNITLASEIDASYPYDVVVAGNYAYYGDRDHIVVSDISDVTNPQEIGRLDLSSRSNDIAISGDYAYVANGGNGLVILDITEPAAPEKVGSYVTDSAYELDVVGNYAYLIDGETTGIVIIDVTNPKSPSLAKIYNLQRRPNDIAIVGNYAYVATGSVGLIILDITEPTAPMNVGIYREGYEFVAKGVAVKDNYAYVATGSDGLKIIDITNPKSPSLIGNPEVGFITNCFSVSNNYLYVEQYSEFDIMSGFHSKKLVILDITDPTIPRIVGKYKIEQVLSCTIKDNYVFVATGNDGVKILSTN